MSHTILVTGREPETGAPTLSQSVDPPFLVVNNKRRRPGKTRPQGQVGPLVMHRCT